MGFRGWSLAFLVTGFLLLNLSCGTDPGSVTDKPQEKTDPGRDSVATVNLVKPVTYECLGSGCRLEGAADSYTFKIDTSLDRAIASLELYAVDGETPLATVEGDVSELQWQVEDVEIGLNELFVRVTDEFGHTYDTVPVTVMVTTAARATVPDYTDGAPHGMVDIPDDYDGTQHTCAKHHWIMPAGITKVMAIAEWWPTDDTVWDMVVNLGSGFCPNSGVAWDAGTPGNTSPIVKVVENPEGFAEETAFVHFEPEDPFQYIGKTAQYRLSVYLMR